MNSEEDNSDFDEFSRKEALPVADFDEYDENVPPKSGEEYLRRVQLEEKNYPEVLRTDSNFSKPVTSKDDPAKPDLRCKFFCYLDDNRVPDAGWIDNVISEFSNLRLKIGEIRKRHGSRFESSYPKYKNLELIWWRDVFESETRLPLLTTVLEYPQDHLENGIKFITKYLKESKKITDNQGIWIYTLLACVELPLQANFYNHLRNLSYVLSYIRSKHNGAKFKKNIRSINLIIYLIGKYFQQFDLIDTYGR